LTAAEQFIQKKLGERRAAGNYRSLKQLQGLVDFCSNDYLGFAQSAVLKAKTAEEVERNALNWNGSTGSRLLSGNSGYAEDLEHYIAVQHGAEAGLFFNSGYDANLGLFSSLPQRGDTIITDELIHASTIDGARLSYANRYWFKHNDLDSLADKLKNARGTCYVAIESVYSMDGDQAPIADILDITERYNAHLIADEAHAIGLYGFGLVKGDLVKRVFARVLTFGKALGCHGAIVLGSTGLKNYLINFARSFIYTTSLPAHQLASVRMAYELLHISQPEVAALEENIRIFKESLINNPDFPLIPSESAIQCLVLGSNAKTTKLAAVLQSGGLDARPILSPTVPAGSERIRICLHSFNSPEEIYLLTNSINHFINAQ
jgi:8-amino-7-oxononanoate synthase